GRRRAALELGDHRDSRLRQRLAQAPAAAAVARGARLERPVLERLLGQLALAPLELGAGAPQDLCEHGWRRWAHVPACEGARARLACRSPPAARAAPPSAGADRAAWPPSAIESAPPPT